MTINKQQAGGADNAEQRQAINFRFATNSGLVREEEWKGRQFLVVPGYTLPHDIVMNRILYPADEIDSSYKTLEDTIAPYDHPYDDNGNPVPAKSTDGLVKHHIGAYNRNVRIDGNRVYLEKWIDKGMAEATENGRAVLNAIAKGEPLETSTGLTYRPVARNGESNGKKYDMVATNMVFDHDAILPAGVAGAARPADGVGMLVNCAQFDEDEYIAANTSKTERAIMAFNLDVTKGQGVDWLRSKISEELSKRYPMEEYGVCADDMDGERVTFRAKSTDGKRHYYMIGYKESANGVELVGEPVEVETKVSIVQKAINSLASVLGLARAKSVVKSAMNDEQSCLSEDEDQINEVPEMDETQVKALVETAVNAAVQPLQAANEALKGEIKALTDQLVAVNAAERDALEAKVVGAKLLDAVNAKALPMDALRQLAANLETAGTVHGTNSQDQEPQGLSRDL